MKKIAVLIIPLFCLGYCSIIKEKENKNVDIEKRTENVFNKINKTINISNELIFDKEIRIYKKFSTTNGTEIFRIYNKKDNWNVELYKYFDNIKENEVPKFEKLNISSSNDLNLVWLYLLESNVEFLLNIDKIDYKLKGKPLYELFDGKYEVIHQKIKTLDGVNYYVFVKNEKKMNEFIFNNPESYFKHYPNVDELNSYLELLSVINREFKIWDDK